MDIHTENLTILFVDIAGFTATTNRQSRAENAALLHTFDSTLLPLIKRFKGRVVKSIGDALLLTFRSPTDAMLCAMALQDAMHAHNLRVMDGEKIHIRIAASLGEVRVTPKDIFGEPVNVASRIEGIAPADEIYLSEAVFMAMNKAEVPAQEVGFKELAGMPQPIRIYSIPRFATHRLIPQNAVPDQGGEWLFPYGGMHHRLPNGSSANNRFAWPSLGKYAAGVAVILAAVLGAKWAMQGSASQPATAPTINAEVATVVTTPTTTLRPAASEPVAKPELKSAAGESVPAPKPVASAPSPKPLSSRALPAPVAIKESSKPEVAKAEAAKPAAPKKVEQPVKQQWTMSSAKEALRSGRISKAEYKAISRDLQSVYKSKAADLKSQYKANTMSRSEYEQALDNARQSYLGD